MKTRILTAMALTTLALGTSATAASFTPGNLVICRVGDGSNVLADTGNTVFLDEYTTSGALVQSVMMPTNYFGAQSPLIANGRAVSEGEISRSADGRFVILTGYGATLGQVTNFSLPSEFSIIVPRVVGLVDGFGHIDTTTPQTNSFAYSETIRSAATTDGTNLWLAGDSGGIRYTTRGSSDSTQLSTFITDIRQLNIFSNELYFSTGTDTRGIYAVTNGLPTTANAFYQVLSNQQSSVSSPYGFVLLSLPGGPAGLNTLYVADDNNGGAIYKWSLLSGGGPWHSNGVVNAVNARYLTGTVVSTNVQLYVAGSPSTGGGSLYAYIDTTGWNAAPSANGGDITGAGSLIASVPTNEAIHGIAFAPIGGETGSISDQGRISVGPVTDFYTTGLRGGPFTITKTYSVANPGTNSVNWSATAISNWVTLSPASGALSSGASITVTASFNANANALAALTNTSELMFQNTTSGLGNTARPVTLIISDQLLTPSTGFTSSGPSTGPFSPLTKVYTISNGVAPGTIIWSVSKSATWLDLSATSGSLGAGAGTNITVSINTANASALALGDYSDVVTFSNVTAATLLGTRNADLNIGQIYFFDDLSTFNSAPLVGQRGWTRVPSAFTLPLQVSGGHVVIPAGQSADNEDAYKNFPQTTSHVAYAGMTLTVSNAPSGIPSYFAALYASTNAGGFANYRLGASNVTAGTFALTARITGQTGSPFVAGPGGLSYGMTYRVIVTTDAVGSNMTVYVNPTSGTLGAQTPYMTRNIAGGTPPLSVGSFVISQFADATIHNVGLSIGKVAVSTNYADVYNFLTPSPSGTINSWINSTGDVWTTASNWSQGVPNSTQALVQIANSGIKTVSYAVTAVQTISNLLVSAPAGSFNTLSATATLPPNRGLTVLNSLTISSGGALAWNGNVLSGRELTVSGVSGGGITVDGDLTIANGRVVASNAVTTIGEALFGSAQMTMSNGLFFTYSVLVPDPDTIGNTGTFNLLGGTMNSTYLVVGGGSNTGIVAIANATLVVTNGGIYVGNSGDPTQGTGFGQMTISNASVTANTVVLGSSAGGHGVLTIEPGAILHIVNDGCAACGFSQNEGILDGGMIDAPSSPFWAGRTHPGALIVSNGVGTFLSGYVGFDSTGTLTMPNGSLTVLSNLVVGNCGASVAGIVSITGGSLFVTNGAGAAVLDVRDGTVTVMGTGKLNVDKIVITNSCGHLVHTAGALQYSQLNLDPSLSAGGSGIPNGWALQYGLDPFDPNLANEDPDGDGMNNLQEYLAGSNPVLDIKSITKQGNDIRVTWQAAANKTNALQFVNGPNYTTNFTDLFVVTNTDGTVTNYLDLGGATNSPTRYYRVRLSP